MRNVWTMALALTLGAVAPAIACEGGACEGEVAKKAAKATCDGGACEGEEVAKKAAKATCDGGACEGEVAKKVAAKASCDGGTCEAGGSLSATYERLMGMANNGCDVSKAQLGYLNAACSAKTDQEAAEGIAKLEAAAAKGCKESAAKLKRLEHVLAMARTPLSKQIARLTAAAEKGCPISKKTLAALGVACETGACTKSLMAKVTDLEAKAAKGCKVSNAALATLRGKLIATALPASATPAKQAKAKAGCEGEAGCDSAKTTDAAAKAACEGGDCATEQVKAEQAKKGGCCEGGAASTPLK